MCTTQNYNVYYKKLQCIVRKTTIQLQVNYTFYYTKSQLYYITLHYIFFFDFYHIYTIINCGLTPLSANGMNSIDILGWTIIAQAKTNFDCQIWSIQIKYRWQKMVHLNSFLIWTKNLATNLYSCDSPWHYL